MIVNDWYNGNGLSDCADDVSGVYDNEEYRERIKMKLRQIIGDCDFNHLIRNAVRELMSEI